MFVFRRVQDRENPMKGRSGKFSAKVALFQDNIFFTIPRDKKPIL
jgi:hypothetical protein